MIFCLFLLLMFAAGLCCLCYCCVLFGFRFDSALVGFLFCFCRNIYWLRFDFFDKRNMRMWIEINPIYNNQPIHPGSQAARQPKQANTLFRSDIYFILNSGHYRIVMSSLKHPMPFTHVYQLKFTRNEYVHMEQKPGLMITL